MAARSTRCGTCAGIAARRFAMSRRAGPGGSFARTISGPTAATARSSRAAACRTISTRRAGLAARASCASWPGLIYVSLSDNPPDFERGREHHRLRGRPQGLGTREGGEDRRLRRRRELENRVGEQSRVLPLQRESSAVHQGEFRPLTTPTTRASEFSRGSARRSRAAKKSGRPPASRSAIAQSGMTQFPGRRSKWLVCRESHAARRRLRQRNDERPAGRAADGRLHGCRRRHAAHSHAAQYVAPRQLRSRRHARACCRPVCIAPRSA